MDKPRTSFKTISILMAIPLAGLAIFFAWQWINGGATPQDAIQTIQQSTIAPSPRASAPAPEPALPRVQPKHRTHRGDIVLIIDDLGFDGQPLDELMALDPNVNCSILPNGTRATEFAERLHARGFEVLCHLPMQPIGHEAPGRNAILTSMKSDEIARLTRENVDAIPYALGVNNHMGSLATTDRRVMTSVIGALPEGMYFVDSRTTGGSIAGTVAKEMNVRTATRNIFLDDVATASAVRKQLAALAATAESRGTAIGIGHPHPVTVRVLTEELPALKARGFRLVRASTVVR
jgi:polysaccharide deacetylase 2 family uncharacterized protein YibQ